MAELERIKELAVKTGSGLEELLKKEFKPKGMNDLDILLAKVGAPPVVPKCGKNCKCFAARDAMRVVMKPKPSPVVPSDLKELPKAPKRPGRKGPKRGYFAQWEPLEMWYELEVSLEEEEVEEVIRKKICACGDERCRFMETPLKEKLVRVKKKVMVKKLRKVLKCTDGEC